MTEEKKGLDEKPLDKMTVTELREIAKDIPTIVGASGMKKPELLTAIKAARGIVDDAPKKTGQPREKAEIKAMIKALKEKRLQAQQAKDRKMTDRVRRQISRLKKKSRQAA